MSGGTLISGSVLRPGGGGSPGCRYSPFAFIGGFLNGGPAGLALNMAWSSASGNALAGGGTSCTGAIGCLNGGNGAPIASGHSVAVAGTSSLELDGGLAEGEGN